jgi:hypothetical protein
VTNAQAYYGLELYTSKKVLLYRPQASVAQLLLSVALSIKATTTALWWLAFLMEKNNKEQPNIIKKFRK